MSRAASPPPAPAPVRVDTDADGYQYRRGEVIALDLDAAGLERAKELGYQLVSSERLVGADATLHLLRGRPDTEGSLTNLRKAAPAATLALNHVFGPAGDVGLPGPTSMAAGRPCACRVGIIDTGVDPSLGALRHLRVVQRGFGGAGEPQAQAHGDAVAALLAAEMMGPAGPPSTSGELLVADIFAPGPRSSSAAALVSGLSWLAESGAPVVNISLTGPPNPVVAKVLAKLWDKGVVVVAAAGNDGVAAPPAFPAAYPQVIAVTAVDRQRRPYRYANRGAYIMFSALGVDVTSLGPNGASVNVTGTSFASPIVAMELARRLPSADPQAARKALQGLAASAVDLGAPGRDPIFGIGLIEPRP